MTANTPERGYTYPQSTDHDRLWEHFQELATDLDTDIAALVEQAIRPPIVALSNGAQNVSTGGSVLTYSTEIVDTHGYHSAGAPTRITPTVAGWHTFIANVQFTGATGGTNPRRGAGVRLNGSTIYYGQVVIAGSASVNLGCIAVVDLLMNGSTDYVECWGFQDSGGSVAIGDVGSSRFSGRLVYRT